MVVRNLKRRQTQSYVLFKIFWLNSVTIFLLVYDRKGNLADPQKAVAAVVSAYQDILALCSFFDWGHPFAKKLVSLFVAGFNQRLWF